jgi:membrane-associated protein
MMLSDTILQLVEQYGYIIFFLAFGLGPFGIPVPNEVTILTGGILVDNGVLNFWITYGCILLGLLLAVTVGYLLGKFVGSKVLAVVNKKKRGYRHLIRAQQIYNKYGDIALCLGLFIPVVRYLMPVLAGTSGVRYKKFAMLTYSTAIIWTAGFFTLGVFYGDHIPSLLQSVNVMTVIISVLIIALLVVLFEKLKGKSTKRAVKNEI